MIRAFVSQLMPLEMRQKLADLGLNVKQITPSKNLHTELRYHPDLLIFQYAGKVYCDASISGTFDFPVIPVRGIKDEYPFDCLLNLLTNYEQIICGKKVKKLLYEELAAHSTIDVNQGYVRCSTVKLNDDAYITGDTCICRALTNLGADVLLTDNSGIMLNGFSNGFIGGCSGVYENKLFLTGTPTDHTIAEFAAMHGFDTVCLSNDRLYDYGGIVIVDI